MKQKIYAVNDCYFVDPKNRPALYYYVDERQRARQRKAAIGFAVSILSQSLLCRAYF